MGERVVEGLQHNNGYLPSWECTYLLTVIFLTVRDSPTGAVVSMLGWGDWGKSEMSGKKVQSWRMGVSYCEMSQDNWCWFGGTGGWLSRSRLEERREGAGGRRGLQRQVVLPWHQGAAEGQPLGVDTALYSAPWLWEGDRSLTVEPPRNSKGEELGPKVQERKKTGLCAVAGLSHQAH